MNIITISREFGSGGRELGKRLAEAMGYAYYDRELITAIAEKSDFNEQYVERVLESGMPQNFTVTFRSTFTAVPAPIQQSVTRIMVLQQQILKEVAGRENCVIVGRSADAILADCHPFNIFVYADMEAKLRRCRERAPEGETLTDAELRRKIRQVDQDRIQHHRMMSDLKWGDKEGYHLCINTTDSPIKTLVPAVAQYAEAWFAVER